jgi:hypothetical protein
MSRVVGRVTTGDPVIEKGVPMPKAVNANSVLRLLGVGDSFLTERHPANFNSAAKFLGIKISSRRQPDGKYRVWRTV